MERAVLSRCLRGIEASFSSNEARTNALAFAQKQVHTVINVARVLCRIDPHDSIAVTPGQLDLFVHHAKRILQESSRWDSSNNADRVAGDRGNYVVPIRRPEVKGLPQLRSGAILEFILSLGAHNILQREKGYIQKLLTELRLCSFPGSSLVALIGCFHKSGLYSQREFSNFTEDAFRHLITTSSNLKRLTAREWSLLLWRRVATIYMGGVVSDLHLTQLRRLLYKCYEAIKYDVLLVSGCNSEHLEKFFDVGLPLDPIVTKASSVPSFGNTENRELLRLHQTLGNVRQSAIVLGQMDLACQGRGTFLNALGLSSLVRLSRMIDMAQALAVRKRTDTQSSDTHTKVVLSIRDAIEQSRWRCAYEQPVGISSYTIDVLLRHRET